MAQAVSRRLPTAEAMVQSQASSFSIFNGHSGTGTGSSQNSSVSPHQYQPYEATKYND